MTAFEFFIPFFEFIPFTLIGKSFFSVEDQHFDAVCDQKDGKNDLNGGILNVGTDQRDETQRDDDDLEGACPRLILAESP